MQDDERPAQMCSYWEPETDNVMEHLDIASCSSWPYLRNLKINEI